MSYTLIIMPLMVTVQACLPSQHIIAIRNFSVIDLTLEIGVYSKCFTFCQFTKQRCHRGLAQFVVCDFHFVGIKRERNLKRPVKYFVLHRSIRYLIFSMIVMINDVFSGLA